MFSEATGIADRLHTLSHQPYNGLQWDLLLLKWTIPFRRLLPFYRWSRPFRSHIAGFLPLGSQCFNQRPPLSVVHLCKEGRMKLLTNKAKSHKQNKVDGLTSANFGVISYGFWRWFRTVKIPMDCIRIH